jgi:putative methyltransferase (TIGR04325 family)
LYRRAWTKPLLWTVVEQDRFVQAGLQHFANEELKFTDDLSSVSTSQVDLFILSSVLQYLPDPESLLTKVLNEVRPPVLLIDRTPFHFKKGHRLTRQVVPEHIYKASYPCWFFDPERFDSLIAPTYEKVLELESKGDTCGDFPAIFKGQLWVRKGPK